MTLVKLKDMELGRNYETYVMLNSFVQKTTKTGNEYLELNICDGEIEVTARQFSAEEKDLETVGIKPGSIVRVCINANMYNLSRNYTITYIAVCDDETLSVNDFVRKAPINVDEEFDYIVGAVKRSHVICEEDICFDSISELTIKLLEKYKQEFKTVSAAKMIHHNVIGGLIYHTSSMVKQAEKLIEHYPELDKELLICGTALHDIGKIYEMETTNTGHTEYTDKGRLLGHATLGIEMIEEMKKECGCVEERVLLLEHMLASHHGQLEFGAIVTPAIPEATVLHALDMIDSRIYIFNSEYENMEEGELSGNVYALDNNSIYKAYSLDVVDC